jgi:hypothetical protein
MTLSRAAIQRWGFHIGNGMDRNFVCTVQYMAQTQLQKSS